MRPILFAAALVLCAPVANAQTMWQMNAAYQNQINRAQAMAQPYYYAGWYAPSYRPLYRPAYAPAFGGGYYDSAEAFEIRQLNNTLQQIEGNRQLEAIRNQPWIR